MDAVRFEELKQHNLPAKRGYSVDRFVDQMGAYTTDGSIVDMWINNEESFSQILKLLDIETVDGSRISHYYVIDTQTGSSYDSQTTHRPLKLEGEVNVWGLLSSLIDKSEYASEDSNYRSTIIVRIDDVTTVALGEEVMDVSSEDEHEFVSKHWVAVFNTNTDLDGFTDWQAWDLDQTYAKERAAYKATHEAREIARETAEGITNLSRLKQGDVLKIISLERGDVEHIDIWTVVEDGERVVVTAGPDARRFTFAGGGRWTTRKQNPVQDQEVAMTVSWGSVHPGQHLVYWLEGDDTWSFSETTVKSIEVTATK